MCYRVYKIWCFLKLILKSWVSGFKRAVFWTHVKMVEPAPTLASTTVNLSTNAPVHGRTKAIIVKTTFKNATPESQAPQCSWNTVSKECVQKNSRLWTTRFSAANVFQVSRQKSKNFIMKVKSIAMPILTSVTRTRVIKAWNVLNWIRLFTSVQCVQKFVAGSEIWSVFEVFGVNFSAKKRFFKIAP